MTVNKVCVYLIVIATNNKHRFMYTCVYAMLILGLSYTNSCTDAHTHTHTHTHTQFDPATGILTITGDATVDVYADILTNITYFNK